MSKSVQQVIDVVPIDSIKLNEQNPRKIIKASFEKLKKSVQKFPVLIYYRPIIIDENNTIISGNHRYQACKELGWQQVPVLRFLGGNLEKKQLAIKDNLQYATWDFSVLPDFAPKELLADWGIDLFETLAAIEASADSSDLQKVPVVSTAEAVLQEKKENETHALNDVQEENFEKRKLTILFSTEKDYQEFVDFLTTTVPECFTNKDFHEPQDYGCALIRLIAILKRKTENVVF